MILNRVAGRVRWLLAVRHAPRRKRGLKAHAIMQTIVPNYIGTLGAASSELRTVQLFLIGIYAFGAIFPDFDLIYFE
jgi:hypothetical protein